MKKNLIYKQEILSSRHGSTTERYTLKILVEIIKYLHCKNVPGLEIRKKRGRRGGGAKRLARCSSYYRIPKPIRSGVVLHVYVSEDLALGAQLRIETQLSDRVKLTTKRRPV